MSEDEITLVCHALVKARDGLLSERATGLPMLSQYRDDAFVLVEKALQTASHALAALAQPPAQPDRLYDALCWALGVGDDWKPRPDGAGPFYWRKELAERAGICWDGSRYVMAAQPPAPTAQPAKACEWTNCPTRVGDVCCFDRLDRIAKGAAQPVHQPGAEFDHSIGADRFTVHRGGFWWHVRIGSSTSKVGKFHTKLEAEDMALKMLTAYRDGAFEQYQTARAKAAPAQRQPLPTGLRLAAAFTRADLGPVGSNYPHVRELLAFAEQALGITAAPAAQKGEKL